VLWNSTDDASQDIWVPKNSHTHANWVFTRPGAYFVTVRAHAKLADGTEVSDTQRLQFAVGDSTDAESVFAQAKVLGEPKSVREADASSGASSDPSSGTDEGVDTATLILLGAGFVILFGGGAAFWVSLRGRRAKEAASVEERRR
jgi:surface-anchored protein